MTNAEVFNAFAAKRIANGGSVRTEAIDGGNGVALFSYGTPIAINSEQGIRFDLQKYSVTTSKHQTGAARAVDPREYKYMGHASFRALCRELGVYLGAAR